jgi:hypothetical protein
MEGRKNMEEQIKQKYGELTEKEDVRLIIININE